MSYEIVSTETFNRWLAKVKDRQARKAIVMRLTRAEAGNLGDVKPVGGAVSEMRIFVGKGYRVYFTIRDGKLVILLCGGDKSSQARDIQQAKDILNDLED
ncbi:type II toxin-antitoxin system RelE/ParE family toxin [Sansalvadorimonas sp. 2012CJ34-2]|uniref:Type II toxin-antitoxin system RelE/ParE family toxin n=1 Tax=Parendozoicomonas callyspongiae TaxID=2942213 RepID=A0ABT0PLV3_9GAMM|nr:type II toxin-antitoxin system RelE/ParE family toxin [Sansalvadorimonas sp. 2012CJ34-2]MCL6272318.1 type II toxin-antitoxin system RelE/ParE family toxin [Sansalvadorimonas sp. 2012CJ34-2]